MNTNNSKVPAIIAGVVTTLVLIVVGIAFPTRWIFRPGFTLWGFTEMLVVGGAFGLALYSALKPTGTVSDDQIRRALGNTLSQYAKATDIASLRQLIGQIKQTFTPTVAFETWRKEFAEQLEVLGNRLSAPTGTPLPVVPTMSLTDLPVTIVLPSGQSRTADVPTDVPVKDLIPELITSLRLPTTGADGAPLNYRIESKTLGRELREDETLSAAGVPENDRLMLTTI
jgi:hypothetical protein